MQLATPASALAWKEWREVRAFLLIALGVFVLIPLIGGVESMFQYSHRFEISASPFVFFFGGVLAVFVAVGSTCRDLSDRIENFFLSRPIDTRQWLLTKYFTGLVVVLVSCEIPLLLELCINRNADTGPAAIWFPFLWTALYSIGFLMGCLTRRTAHAAMLGIAGMLLLYFLPFVLPPLQFLNSSTVLDRYPYENHLYGELFAFAAGMLVIAASCTALGIVAVKREWQISAGPKLMYASISSVLLIVLASAAFQLGTNMPILQQVDLPKDESVREMFLDGDKGYVLTAAKRMHMTGKGNQVEIDSFVRSIDLSNSEIKLGAPTKVENAFAYESNARRVTAAGHPEIVYVATYLEDNVPDVATVVLKLARLDKGTEDQIDVLWRINITPNEHFDPITTHIYQDRLYVVGSRLVTFDISDPFSPRKLSDAPFRLAHLPQITGGDVVSIMLPQIPDLPARERLAVAAKGQLYESELAGDVLCAWANDAMVAYRLTGISDTTGTFRIVGRYEPTLLERFVGAYYYNHLRIKGDRLYATSSRYSAYANPHIAVFSLRPTQVLKPIAHFAAPGAEVAAPLANGDALVGGSKVWRIGPPPERR